MKDEQLRPGHVEPETAMRHQVHISGRWRCRKGWRGRGKAGSLAYVVLKTMQFKRSSVQRQHVHEQTAGTNTAEQLSGKC